MTPNALGLTCFHLLFTTFLVVTIDNKHNAGPDENSRANEMNTRNTH